jgi:hypothetical protein
MLILSFIDGLLVASGIIGELPCELFEDRLRVASVEALINI